MDPTPPVREATLVERVVLLGLVCHTVEGRSPARVDDIRTTCNSQLDEVTGRLSEANVCQALNELAATELVDEHRPHDRSPAGKGRPSYELCCDVDAVLTALGTDEHLASLVPDVDAMRV